MSFTTELDVYGEIVPNGMIAKSFTEEEPEQCIIPLKRENVEESLVVGEEIVVGANGYLPDKVDCQTETTMYFDGSLENCDEMAVDYEESVTSVPLAKNLLTEKWEDTLASSKESESEDTEGDEETIATFVTAAGQQLALYAVEDSDEIFAVAVYDESGEPPSNFQFLMKADVERLIGEGAVQTVKKPMQMKKQLLTTQPPFYCKNFEDVNEQVDNKISIYDTSIANEKSVLQEEDFGIEHNYKIHQNYDDSIKINSLPSDSVHITADEQSDITYLMMDNSSVNVAEQPDESRDNCESENELMERSTVQYILFEDDHQSDSELTFDEIQATLQNLKTFRQKPSERDDDKSDKSQDDDSSNIQQTILRDSSMRIGSSNGDMNELDFYMSQSTTDRMCVSVSEYDRQQLIDVLTDSPPSTTAPMTNTPLKVKRSRKQQLTSVNRDDGEIIIQPASMLNEEELIGKKRSRRRPRLSNQMRVAVADAKRMKRAKRRIVEVIDLETDEEEQQTKRNVVEITLDDSKDKYSSDKENEIIMVRDSDSDNGDDEEEEEEDEQSGGSLTKLNGLMQCEHCSRNFRQRRAFDTHLRVCQKSPANALRLGERKSKDKEENQQASRKQYACKICQEKFDVVVALARHVRATHSQRKKHKSQDKSLRSVQQKEVTSTEEEEEEEEEELIDNGNTTKRELSMLARVKRKRKQRGNCSWETKKLNCADCGRWFPSSALLDAHSLQHGTKKSEQLRKCRICKKLIRSRLLFLRHLRMHNDAQRSTGNSSRMLRRKLRPRPGARKIMSPRKRGRPRKF